MWTTVAFSDRLPIEMEMKSIDRPMNLMVMHIEEVYSAVVRSSLLFRYIIIDIPVEIVRDSMIKNARTPNPV
jgi:hypothetical protein